MDKLKKLFFIEDLVVAMLSSFVVGYFFVKILIDQNYILSLYLIASLYPGIRLYFSLYKS